MVVISTEKPLVGHTALDWEICENSSLIDSGFLMVKNQNHSISAFMSKHLAFCTRNISICTIHFRKAIKTTTFDFLCSFWLIKNRWEFWLTPCWLCSHFKYGKLPIYGAFFLYIGGKGPSVTLRRPIGVRRRVGNSCTESSSLSSIGHLGVIYDS
jgi:hypothetical protein